jgi:hypothetical protein
MILIAVSIVALGLCRRFLMMKSAPIQQNKHLPGTLWRLGHPVWPVH